MVSVVGTFDERAGEGGQVCGERQVRQRGAQRQHVHGGGRAVQRVRRPHHHHVARRDAALRHTHTPHLWLSSSSHYTDVIKTNIY